MKTNKEIYINFIIDELLSGNVQYKDVHLAFRGKFGLTETSFIKYWKLANERHYENMQAIQKVKQESEAEEVKKEAKRLYLNRSERLEIAFKIAQGQVRMIGGEVIIPSDSDRIRALDYVAKMEGDYKPTKISETDPDGKSIPLIEQLIRLAPGVATKRQIEN